MKNQEPLICQICKEPINSFVCLERLSEDIRGWLPEALSSRFAGFNDWFLKLFSYGYDAGLEHHGMVRGGMGKGSVCLYCYVNEVFQWLLGEDKAVARRFRKLFSFGMGKTDFREITKANAEPISSSVNHEREFGICDECGEYAEDLKLRSGRWVCSGCWGV